MLYCSVKWFSREARRGEILETIIWPNQVARNTLMNYVFTTSLRIQKFTQNNIFLFKFREGSVFQISTSKKHHEKLNRKAPGLLIDGEGLRFETRFGKDDIGVYMGPGVRIARAFGIENPTRVRLDYEGAQNSYKLTRLGDIHIPNVFPARVKEEPIEILSDNEMEVEEVNTVEEGVVENVQEAADVDFYHFEKIVSKSLASLEKPQVLVCEHHYFFQFRKVYLFSFK